VLSWAEFQRLRPDLAEAGRRLLYQFGVGLGFLATVRADGGPGRAKSPLQQVFELMFGVEWGILLTRPDGALGTLGAQTTGLHGSTADNPGKGLTW
jgi:hypothetical protein